MGAEILPDVNFTAFATDGHHLTFTDPGALVASRLGDLAIQCDIAPALTVKEGVQLASIQVRVGIHPIRHSRPTFEWPAARRGFSLNTFAHDDFLAQTGAISDRTTR